MEDRETGAGAPESDASRIAPSPQRGPAEQAKGRGPDRQGSVRAHDGRAIPGDQNSAGKGKKRRKRKRGRKVFARDGAARPADATATPVQGVAAAVSEISTPPPKPQAERQRHHDPAAAHRDLPVFAALDLGTNNCRLLFAVPGRGGQFRVIDAFSRIVRRG